MFGVLKVWIAMALAVALVGFMPTSALAGDGTFGAKTDLTVGAVPSAASVGDFNSDGIADLVATNWADDDVSILLGTGDGSFGAKTDFAVGDQPQAVAVGDFNSNGSEDLAVANYGEGDVSILLGTGNGSFGAKTDFPVGSYPRSLAIGDFNGDRVEDLSVANSSDGDVSILLGSGDGSFGAKTDFPVSFFPPAIAVGDFDSDGYDDLVTPGGYNGNGVSVLLNKADGSGGFEAKTDLLTGDDPFGVAVGDFDSDGFEDIAATNAIDDEISVLLGSGDGTFDAGTDFAVGNGPRPLAAGDFNSDGTEDLAVINDNNVSRLARQGQRRLRGEDRLPGWPEPKLSRGRRPQLRRQPRHRDVVLRRRLRRNLGAFRPGARVPLRQPAHQRRCRGRRSDPQLRRDAPDSRDGPVVRAASSHTSATRSTVASRSFTTRPAGRAASASSPGVRSRVRRARRPRRSRSTRARRRSTRASRRRALPPISAESGRKRTAWR